MAESILKNKSYQFAAQIVKLAQALQNDRKEHVLSKQILRSGTAVGAITKKREFAQSKPDFINKMSRHPNWFGKLLGLSVATSHQRSSQNHKQYAGCLKAVVVHLSDTVVSICLSLLFFHKITEI